MATSAFKSTSKRGNISSDNSTKKAPPLRRSLSVSAVSRTQLDIPSEFSNKRDNPLFWSSGSPPDQDIESENAVGVPKSAENASNVSGLISKVVNTLDSQRGRSVARNPVVMKTVSGGRKEIGRSLSRVDTGRRRRSVSRGHYGAYESEVEQESIVSSNHRNRSNSILVRNDVKNDNSDRKVAYTRGGIKSSPILLNQNPAIEPSDNYASSLQISNWEDGMSTGSLSEAEEKTIKAVSEQMRSLSRDYLGSDTAASGIYETVRSEVRRAITDIQNDLENAIRTNNSTAIANTTAIATTDVADLPPDLVNPGPVELVLDIRREYARKLEESQERARKLRADLAVEEHREQELSRILKEILPDPKTTNVQKSRPGRKTSSERKRMSKRLTEEAMNYFDECVSISTFDSSDFSAPEDPPLDPVGAATPAAGAVYLSRGSPSVSTSCCQNSCPSHNQESGVRGQVGHGHEDSSLTANSSSKESMMNQATLRSINTGRGQKLQFSFDHKPTETVGLEYDIRNYIKNFEKGGINAEIKRSNHYNVDEYNMQEHTQKLLFDRVIFKKRIESGSLHLCGGGFAFSFSPFASLI